jgi:RNA polymerase sigma factor (sigma-70 family)
VRDPSEDELDAHMARLAAGEREAFDPLFRALYPRALRLARRSLSEDRAADAAQQVLMQLFARANEFEAGRAVLPWFYACAANEIHTLRRRAAREARRNVEVTRAEGLRAADEPERALLERELRGALAAAVDALDDEGALAIQALLGDAPRPALAPATFRKRVSRAYARLRLLLGGSLGR